MIRIQTSRLRTPRLTFRRVAPRRQILIKTSALATVANRAWFVEQSAGVVFMYAGESDVLESTLMWIARRGCPSDTWRSRCKMLGVRLRMFHPMGPAVHVFTQLSLQRPTFGTTKDFLKQQSLRFGIFPFNCHWNLVNLSR